MLITAYNWSSDKPTYSASYLTPVIVRCCHAVGARRILDVGCGNGALCAELDRQGFQVEGCDQSVDGVEVARRAHPSIRFHQVSVYEQPPFSGFDAVVSTEVVEHLFLPRKLPQFAAKVLKPGGHLVLSTPYHGYLKNLALALFGAWDKHHSPLWDGGHIKFWSRNTLTRMLEEEGFRVTGFIGAGRLPFLWKSMVLIARMV